MAEGLISLCSPYPSGTVCQKGQSGPEPAVYIQVRPVSSVGSASDSRDRRVASSSRACGKGLNGNPPGQGIQTSVPH